jgi:hypothetical protein
MIRACQKDSTHWLGRGNCSLDYRTRVWGGETAVRSFRTRVSAEDLASCPLPATDRGLSKPVNKLGFRTCGRHNECWGKERLSQMGYIRRRDVELLDGARATSPLASAKPLPACLLND